MTEDSVTLRPATEADRDRILGLLGLVFGQDDPTACESYFRWKHEESPFGESPMLVAEHLNRVVALRAFMRWEWSVGGQSIPAVRAVDTVTHPSFRGRGLFRALTERLVEEMEREGVGFVFNTPNSSSRPGYQKMGWRKAFRAPVLVRVLRPASFLASLLIRQRKRDFGFTRSYPADDLIGLARRCADVPWQGETGRLRTVRTRAYLGWRYLAVPGIAYDARVGGSGAAVILRERDRRGLRELSLSEVLSSTTRESEDSAAELVREVCRESVCTHALAVASSGTRTRAVLRRVGFLPVALLGPWVTLRLLGSRERSQSWLDPKGWDLSLGDLELF